MNTIKTLSAALLLSLSAMSYADIAVIVSKGSAINSISSKELRKIYLGQSTETADGIALTPLDQSDKALHAVFTKNVLRKTGSSLNSYWSRQMFSGKGTPPTQISGGDAGVINMVKGSEKHIAYINADKVNSDVKVVLTISQ